MSPKHTFRQNLPDPATRSLTEAVSYHRAGRLAEAERLYRVVLGLVPRHGEALRLLGGLYLQSGKPEQALPLLQNALQVQPKNLEILNNLGVALLNTGQIEGAETCFRQVLAFNSASAEALCYLGDTLREQGKREAALDSYAQALHLKPDFVAALSGQGAVLWSIARNGDARVKLERASQIEPGNAELITDIGALLASEGKVDEALEYFNRALTQAPECRRALFWKSLALLTFGEYREGWKLYETGLGHPKLRSFNPFGAVKAWDGKPAPDKHLLIWYEQGLGDAMQFIRYAELCKQRVGKVSVLCRKPLVRLFKALPYIDDAFDRPHEGRNAFDTHISIMSLPHRFDTALETVPAAVPYLHVDPESQAKWTAKFAGVAGLKVGVVWDSGSTWR